MLVKAQATVTGHSEMELEGSAEALWLGQGLAAVCIAPTRQKMPYRPCYYCYYSVSALASGLRARCLRGLSCFLLLPIVAATGVYGNGFKKYEVRGFSIPL